MFESILYPPGKEEIPVENPPECFRDLNLDQIFDPILKTEAKACVDRFFYSPVHAEETVFYRQEVMRELEDADLREAFASFTRQMLSLEEIMDCLRQDTADPWQDDYLMRGHIFDCAERYIKAVTELPYNIGSFRLKSAGLCGFMSYLEAYCRSSDFVSFREEAENLRAKLNSLRYCMLIKNGTIRVKKYEGEEDLSAEILRTFEKFRQGQVRDYRQTFNEYPKAQHVESGVLMMLSKLYPEEFREVERFTSMHLQFEDRIILKFSREIRFYISWLEFIKDPRQCDLPICYPEISEEDCNAEDFYDLALAKRIGRKTVTNDFHLDAPERLIVISGPNQGGKTTFARAFGQIHYLASLGLPIPARKAGLMLPDRILTHFEREENLVNRSGKLQDDLERLKTILSQAGSKTVVIVNEIFASTTLQDALLLGQRMMDEFEQRKCIGTIVTFMDELADHGPDTVSMMSLVDPEDPEIRTFRVVRKPPDGLAYAQSLAEKHGLSYEQLKRRLQS